MPGFWILIWTGICLQVLLTCSPVPSPGTTAHNRAPQRIFSMSQTTLFDHGFYQSSCKGEGCSEATVTAGAPDWIQELQNSAKRGQPPPMGYGPQSQPPRPSCVQKRSYRRACARAIHTGAAWYRGQLCTVEHFSPQLVSQLQHRSGITSPRRTHPIRTSGLRNRISCMHWNLGGLWVVSARALFSN